MTENQARIACYFVELMARRSLLRDISDALTLEQVKQTLQSMPCENNKDWLQSINSMLVPLDRLAMHGVWTPTSEAGEVASA